MNIGKTFAQRTLELPCREQEDKIQNKFKDVIAKIFPTIRDSFPKILGA